MESGGRGTSGSDNGGSGLMSFRDHNNSTGSRNGGLSSVVMMMNNMPLLASSHHDHPTPPSPNVVVGMNNALFIPLSNSTNNNNNHHHHHHHNNNNNHNHITHFGSISSDHHQIFNKNSSGGYFMKMNNNKNTICCNNNEEMMSNNSSSTNSSSSFRAKIMAHPHYPRLLTAYVNCQKVGAPPEVVRRLEEVCGSMSEEGRMSSTSTSTSTRGSCIGEDPALDQFMEAYCEMLTKYEQELTKPFKEAMLFISNIESQLKSLTVASSDSGGSGSPEDEIDPNDENYIDPQAEDKELKIQLLRKYSGYLGSLKQEFLKKRKKGKLPKEARQKLLDWWSRHYKWPYPSEGQKLALGETTGLDQKQINNWFINQRKRHWKPSEEMQFVVMDPAHPNQYYIENVMTTNPFALDYCNQML